MQIREIMTRSVELIDPNTRIKDAAERMRDDNIGALPVGENDRLVGMVTDRDLAVRAVAAGRAPTTTAVREVMSEKVFYCFEDNSLEDAARVMAEHQVHRLPVLNRDKRLVGIVALADLARTSDAAAREAICGISEPTETPRR
jgi:CBS domain-containing protein